MASLTQASRWPNILIADGIDPSTEFRPELQAAIYSKGNTTPVRRGSHDFWFCFPFPPQNEFNPTSANFGYGDAEAASAGRALRGVGEMRRLPIDVTVGDIEWRLFTGLHEA